MKKLITICATLIFATTIMYAWSFDDLTSAQSDARDEVEAKQEAIAEGFDAFSIDMSNSLTNTAALQNVWADAYLGKLLPSIIPHFGAGINFGAASLDATGLNTAVTPLGLEDYIPETLAIPVINAEAKIGGIILPFDLGVSIMKFDSDALENFDIDFVDLELVHIDYFSVGANFRYALLQQNVILPNVSIGALYNYTSGNISVNQDDTEASFDYKTHTYGLEAQVSKNFLGILTPFGGGRVLMVASNNDWDYSMKLSGDAADVYEALYETEIVSDSGNYTYTVSDYTGIGDLDMQLFAGLGVNLFIIQLTPSVSYDFTNQILGGAFSVHVKL